jgi:hypothetical protein
MRDDNVKYSAYKMAFIALLMLVFIILVAKFI